VKNGVEVRKNGNEIREIGICYYVYLKQEDGSFIESQNGPWDYLNNARRCADVDE